ncbi:MAG: ABC transporter ATP-binding protein [Prevotellaceae bacterium]|jgi:ABC-type multidrug transport system ATPase subunit|nr:ABC transporter ATP-binding protein [Prevotellaceae bacterium]
MVTVNNLTKRYDNVEALRGINFSANDGEIFGIIGPDGAGKTSLFRILTTLILADGGTATVNGLDVVKDYREIRNTVGYMPGKFSLYQDLTVDENLNFFATVFNTTVEDNYELVKDIYQQIEPFKKRKAEALSGGMKQKLALSCALIHKPTVLFLDEPTTGVDPVSRKEFWEMLKNLKQQGISILVSTPYMDEASLCDRIALIQSGEIMNINTPSQIIADFPDKLYAVKAANNYHLLNELKQKADVKSCYMSGEYLHVTFKTENEPTIDNIKMHVIQPTIEDCFIRLMK